MKKLRTMALALAAITAVIVFTGFSAGTKTPVKQSIASEEVKDSKPVRSRCLYFDGNRFQTIGYFTTCQTLIDATCMLNSCPSTDPGKDQRPILARCVNSSDVTVAYATSCVPKEGSLCTLTACPEGTKIVVDTHQ